MVHVKKHNSLFAQLRVNSHCVEKLINSLLGHVPFVFAFNEATKETWLNKTEVDRLIHKQ
jgi:hypothetical protein